jgi:cell division transport system permease protein
MKNLFSSGRRRTGATPVAREKLQRPSGPPAETRSSLSTPPGRPPGAFILLHLQVFVATLGQLSRAPIATLMTAAVIGIALALPAGLYAVLSPVQAHSTQWHDERQISVFLKPGISDAQAGALADRLRTLPGVSQVKLISRSQGLEEMRKQSGFAEALAMLDENPLPALLVVYPTPPPAGTSPAQAVTELLTMLRALPEADAVQFDMQWLQRLEAILRVVERGVTLLAGLLALGVLLIVSNTLRLAILSRREEIEIIKLIGATDAFIRRPFLYLGLGYGLLGGVIAWALVTLALGLLRGPIEQLARLYSSDFQLIHLSLTGSLVLLSLGGTLGLFGALLAVHRHLAAIEPT